VSNYLIRLLGIVRLVWDIRTPPARLFDSGEQRGVLKVAADVRQGPVSQRVPVEGDLQP